MGVGSWREPGSSFGTEGVVDTISYLAFAAPIAYFIEMLRSPKVTAPERKRVLAYIPLFVAAMLFWMINEQAASSLSAFAEDKTDLSFLWWTIEPAFFQSVNPLIIIVLAPVFAGVWSKLAERGPSTAHKFGIGLSLAALSFVFLAATTLLAPAAFRSQAMALWFLAPAAGQAITAQLVSATDDLANSYATYFGTIGVVTLAIAGVFFLVTPWITRRIREGEEA